MKKRIAAVCMLFIIFSLNWSVSAVFAANAVVDYAEVLRHAPGYKEALRGYNEAVARQKPDFEKKRTAARTERERTALRENYERFCKEQRRTAFADVLPLVNDALRQIGHEKGYAAVYDKAQGKTGPDITQEAIALLSRQRRVPAEQPVPVPAATESKPAVMPPISEAKTKRKQLPAHPISAGKQIIQTETKAQPKQSAGNGEVQFGAGNSKEAIDALVAHVKKNGIETAYTAEARDKNGKILWRARARAASAGEAQLLSAKLSRLGLKNFIVKK